jgi:hypothetical protein
VIRPTCQISGGGDDDDDVHDDDDDVHDVHDDGRVVMKTKPCHTKRVYGFDCLVL